MKEKLLNLYYNGELDKFNETLRNINLNEIEDEELKILKILSMTILGEYNKVEEIINLINNLQKKKISIEYQSIVGLIYTLLGLLDDALNYLDSLLHTNNPYVFYRIGNVYLLKNDYKKAQIYLNKGIELLPKPEAYINLAYIFLQQKEYKQALKSYLKAWSLRPYVLTLALKILDLIKEYDLQNYFTDFIIKEKENNNYLILESIIEYYLNNNKEKLFQNLMAALKKEENNEDLRKLFIDFMMKEEKYWILGVHLKEWVKKYDLISEHLALAECRIKVGFLDKAEEDLLKIKNRITTENLDYQIIYSKLLKEKGQYDKAEKILNELYKDFPNYKPLVVELSDLYRTIGKIKESVKLLEKLGDSSLNVLMRKVETEKNIKEEDIKKLEEHYKNTLDSDVKASIAYSIAEGYQKLKKFDKSSFYLKKANDLIYKDLDYSIEDFTKKVDFLIKNFTREWLEAKKNLRKFSKKPIFIVGMPRSGTTMLEQIFAAHKDVYGAGELSYLPKIIKLSQKLMKLPSPKSIFYMPKKLIYDAAEYYIKLLLKEHCFNEPIFVDKLPHNFLYSPLLLAMFPDAKIIALRRDYRSIALSNYFQNFLAKKGLLGYSFNLEAMGYHIKDYLRIMKYYKKILPKDRYREFWYEDLVLNPKDKIPEVLEFCELNFTPEVLEFYKNKTAVKTASVLQVRNPIYTKSLQKWKNYEKLLKPVIDIVGNEGIYELKD